MDTPQKAFRRAVAALLVGPILALGQPAPAPAEVIGAAGAGIERARIERAVVDALVRHGVDAAQAKARAAALTDAEAARIAKEIESLPAGGADPLTGALMLGIVVGRAPPPESRDGPPPEPRY